MAWLVTDGTYNVRFGEEEMHGYGVSTQEEE